MKHILMLSGTLSTLWLVTAAYPADTSANTVEQLEKDNPLHPLPEIPLGLGKSFDSLPQEDRPTPEKVRLGRWLFFDARISKDRTISCATCHRPRHAFSEPTPVSTGIDGQKGGRKAPTFLNAAWALYPHVFWDGRAASLEDQAVGPMANPIEMGSSHPDVTKAVSDMKGYREYFKEAFGNDQVSLDRIAKAIASYERTRLSGNSPWDRWQAEPDPEDSTARDDADAYGDEPAQEKSKKQYKDGKHVSAKVKLGHELFHGKAACNQCHLGPNFTDTLFHNLGVGWDPEARTYKDEGRYGITKVIDDMGAFKTPTLREVTKHPPYMHDGSVLTLRDVVVLYNKGGEANPHLSPKIKPLELADDEIDALVAFLEALDGEGYLDMGPKLFPQ